MLLGPGLVLNAEEKRFSQLLLALVVVCNLIAVLLVVRIFDFVDELCNLVGQPALLASFRIGHHKKVFFFRILDFNCGPVFGYERLRNFVALSERLHIGIEVRVRFEAFFLGVSEQDGKVVVLGKALHRDCRRFKMRCSLLRAINSISSSRVERIVGETHI